MPIPFMAVTAAMSVASGLMGKSAADKAAKNAEEMAELQAGLKSAEGKENLRRMKFQQDQELGAAKATSYAAGLLNTGSTQQFQQTMKEQWNADMAWERTKNRLEVAAIQKGGAMAADSAKASGTASLISGITGAVSAASSFVGSDSQGYFLGSQRGPG